MCFTQLGAQWLRPRSLWLKEKESECLRLCFSQMWVKVDTADIPETAYMVMTDDYWGPCAEKGAIVPEGGCECRAERLA